MMSTPETNPKNPTNETPIILNSLADLSTILPGMSASQQDPSDSEGNPQSPPFAYSDQFNNTYNVVSLVMYLIGVQKRHFENHVPSLEDQFNQYEAIKDARIIRNLCRTRTAFIQNYSRITQSFRFELKNIATLPDLIPSDAVNQLVTDGIILQKTVPDALNYQIAINKEISNRINNIKTLFPEWIKWDYIRPLFIMPNGQKAEGVKATADTFNSDWNQYPYQCYINWNGNIQGNILISDYKFVRQLYENYEDYFENRSLVVDAGNKLKADLFDFIKKHECVLVVVDCENADPIKLAAALSSLSSVDKTNVHKVILFDSDYTTVAWNTFCHTGITQDFPTEHIVVERLNEHKSQVDMTLAVTTSREIYTSGVDSVILVSSDSDYWALIRSLPDVPFLVMLEKAKTGSAIQEVLEENQYRYCFIDEFCTGASYTIKTKTILGTIQNQIDDVVNFNLHDILNEVVKSTWLTMTEKEKKNFYDRYLKTARLKVETDGAVKVLLGP